jgi:hypothetical protein
MEARFDDPAERPPHGRLPPPSSFTRQANFFNMLDEVKRAVPGYLNKVVR